MLLDVSLRSMMFKYKIFGYNVLSEIELECYSEDFIQPDVIIKNVSEFAEVGIEDNLNRVSEYSYWFYIKGIGAYEVLEGNQILVFPENGYDHKELEMFILGSCFGVLMIQNNEFPLHGSFLKYHDCGIGIVGDSGAGKTSLATGISQNTGKIITDDVMHVSYYDNIPFVNPSYPSQKIWSSTAAALGVTIDKSKSILKRVDKYYRNDKTAFSNEIVELKYLFEVVEADVDEVQIIKMSKTDSLDLLIRNSYRGFVIPHLKKLKNHLIYMMTLNNKIETYIIKRPKDKFTVLDQVKTIDSVLGEKNEQIS